MLFRSTLVLAKVLFRLFGYNGSNLSSQFATSYFGCVSLVFRRLSVIYRKDSSQCQGFPLLPSGSVCPGIPAAYLKPPFCIILGYPVFYPFVWELKKHIISKHKKGKLRPDRSLLFLLCFKLIRKMAGYKQLFAKGRRERSCF